MAEDMVLDALDAELSAQGRTTMAGVSAATLDSCEPRQRGEIMNRVEKSLQRADQLRRLNLYDSHKQLGLTGFGKGQKMSLVKLFRMTKKRGIIQAIHEQACQTSMQQD